jgi:GxxExxY protein
MLKGKPEWNVLTHKILGACFDVHRAMGAGLLESVYEECLALELGRRGLRFEQQKPIDVLYHGMRIPEGFRLDFLVEDTVILELKSVEKLHPVHVAQLLSYLKFADRPIGLLINFHTARLREGIKRFLNA